MTARALDLRDTLDYVGSTLTPSKLAYDSGGLPISLACSGEVLVSSSKALARDVPIVHDVNGYYRELGVAAPYRPDRMALRRAYEAADGQNSPRLTYVLKQLLDEALRRRYDRMPLGSRFDDEYEWAKVDRVSSLWAGQQTAVTGQLHTAEDFHRAMGMTPVAVRKPAALRYLESFWPFAYYLWDSRCFDDDRLQRWQNLVIDEAWERGLTLRFAVGYVGRTPERWIHAIHDGRLVAFLNDAVAPTCQDARELLDSFAPDTAHAPTRTHTAAPHTPLSHPHEPPQETVMADDAATLEFSRGGHAAQEQAKEEAAARKAARGNSYLSSVLKEDGDEVIIRFITDDGPNGQNIYVDQHYVPTKRAPRDMPKDATWPDRWGAVCRYTKVGPPDAKKPAFTDCYICDVMRTDKGKRYGHGPRGWAIAVVRKEMIGTQEMLDAGQIEAHMLNQVVGFVDDLIEVDEVGADGVTPTGRKIQKKNYVIINMGMKNFWNHLLGFFKTYKTLLDRDYQITRVGDGMEVDYLAVPLDVITKPVKDDSGNVVSMETFDLRNPKFAALYANHGIDIPKLITRQISKDYYDRYFDERVEVAWKSEDDDDSTGATSSSSSRATVNENSATAKPTGVHAAQLEAMKADLMSSNSGGGSRPPLVDMS